MIVDTELISSCLATSSLEKNLYQQHLMPVVFPIFKPPIFSLVSPDLPLHLDSTIDKPSSLYIHIKIT